jgi:hypothetical protein
MATHTSCHPEPRLVILSHSFVIPSKARNLLFARGEVTLTRISARYDKNKTQ